MAEVPPRLAMRRADKATVSSPNGIRTRLSRSNVANE
jgi:hypothetical protein